MLVMDAQPAPGPQGAFSGMLHHQQHDEPSHAPPRPQQLRQEQRLQQLQQQQHSQQRHTPPTGQQQLGGAGEEEEAEEPPPPLQPLAPQDVRVPQPQLVAAQYSSAGVQWPAASYSLQEAADERQAAYQVQLRYMCELDVQVQAVAVGPPSAARPVEQLLAQVAAACTEGGWKSVQTMPAAPLGASGGGPVTIPALRAGRFYAARLAAKLYAELDGEEPWRFEGQQWVSPLLAFRTEPCSPGQMQAPSLAQRQRNALKLKWNPPDESGGEEITRYDLKVRPAPPTWDALEVDEEGFALISSSAERSFLLNKLGPAQRFSFKIRCFNLLGSGPWSLPSTFTTSSSVPSQPELPRKVASTKDSLTLQWEAPAPNGSPVTFYEMEMDDGLGGDFQRAYTGPEAQCLVLKLQSGYHYRFRLRAQNSEGWSMWSPVLEASTAAAVPTAPLNIEFRRVTPSAVSLSWEPPLKDGGTPISVYQVELLAKHPLAAAALGDDWSIIFQGQQLAASFEALLPGCTYQVRVAAINEQGIGDYSAPKWLSAGASTPMAPDAPKAFSAEARALFIDWQPPHHNGGAPILRYRLECRAAPCAACPGGGEWVIVHNGPHTGSPAPVANLEPGTAYEFRVAAINEHGSSEASPVVSAATTAAEPLQPALPQLQGVSSSSVKLAWREPHGQGAAVTKYRINVACLPSGTGAGALAIRDFAHSRSSSSNSAAGMVIGSDADGCASDDAASTCSGGGGGGAGAPSGSAGSKLRWDTGYAGPATHAELKQLKPARRYLVQVRAFNAVGGSPWSKVLEVTTQPAAPGPPASLAAAAASSSSMALTWRAPAEDNGAPVVSYVLEMAAGSASSNHAGSSAWTKVWQGSSSDACGSSGSHTVDGLLPGRRYSWRLRAANSCGLGPWAEAVDGKTLPAAPGAAAKPSVSKITAHSAIIKWTIPLEDNGSSVDSYTLQVRRQDVGDWETLLERSALLTHKATELQPGCLYEARVAAANRAGSGPFSEAVGWTTSLLPPAAPRSVAAELSQQPVEPAEPPAAAAGKQQQPRHSVAVSWQAARTPCSAAQTVGYEVEAAPTAAPSAPGASSSSSSSHAAAVKANVGQVCTAQLSGLRGGLTYHVRVRAVGKGGAGHSPWSEAVTVEMPPAPAESAAADDSSSSSPAPADAPGKRSAKARKGAKASAAAEAEADAAAGSKRRARPKPKQSAWGKVQAFLWQHKWAIAGVVLVMFIAMGLMRTAQPPVAQQGGVATGAQEQLPEQQHAAVATGAQEQQPEQQPERAHLRPLLSPPTQTWEAYTPPPVPHAGLPMLSLHELEFAEHQRRQQREQQQRQQQHREYMRSLFSRQLLDKLQQVHSEQLWEQLAALSPGLLNVMRHNKPEDLHTLWDAPSDEVEAWEGVHRQVRSAELLQQRLREVLPRFAPEQREVLQQYARELGPQLLRGDWQQLLLEQYRHKRPEEIQQHLEKVRGEQRLREVLPRFAPEQREVLQQYARELGPQLLRGDWQQQLLEQYRHKRPEEIQQHLEKVRREQLLQQTLVAAPKAQLPYGPEPEAPGGAQQHVHAAAAGPQPAEGQAPQQPEAAPAQQPQPEEQSPEAAPAVAYGLQ